jgi:tetratricopeptide (TPR) repeat protein
VSGGSRELRERIGLLRTAAREAQDAGRLREALALFDATWLLAAELGDPAVEDLAFCNRSALAISLGDFKEPVAELRRILNASSSRDNGFLAAYNLACAYYHAKEFPKGLFYARTARERASELGKREWLAWSHNQLANVLIALNRGAEAEREYEAALSLIAEDPSVSRGRILDNLGYCRILAGRLREAFELLFASVRMLRRLGAEEALVYAHLDLSYAYLEIDRPRSAGRHAGVGLELARRTGATEEIPNALYLLGESALMGGDLGAARDCFSRLQERYPETPHLTDFLLAVDIRGLINLKA